MRALLLLAMLMSSDHQFAMKVVAVDGKAALIQLYVAPLIAAESTSKVKVGDILDHCQQMIDQHSYTEHKDSVVEIECKQGHFELKAVYLGGGQ